MKTRFEWLLVAVAATMLMGGCCKKELEEDKGGKQVEPKKEAPAPAPAEAPAAAAPAEAAPAEAAPAAAPAEAAPAAAPAAAAPAAPPAEAAPAEAAPAAAPAEAAPAEAAPAEAKLLVASYEVAGLDDAQKVRSLTMALADRDGVVSAKADKEAGLFKVTFSAGCPNGIAKALQTVDPGVQFKGVTDRDGQAPTGGCGSCPKQGTCGGTH